MHKQRTVSAIRDFPPDCGSGSSSSRIDESSKEDSLEPSSEHLVGKEILEDSGLRKAGEIVKYDAFHEMGFSAMAKTRTVHIPGRRVSAIRDFPPWCGPISQHNLAEDDTNSLKIGCDFHGNATEEVKKLGNLGRIIKEKSLLKKEKEIVVSHGKGKELESWEKNYDSIDVTDNNQDLSIHPLGLGNSNSNVNRTKVRETLRLFQVICRKLLRQDPKLKRQEKLRVDMQAAKILKEKDKYVNTGKPIIGSVPGIEVGDEFLYWVELNIVGLHRQILGGIDYVKLYNGKTVATSIVASGHYDDELDNTDELIYSGAGGNVIKTDKEPEDQQLVRGNLALKNSIDRKNPVRVIRRSESLDGTCKKIYAYCGLYEVQRYWQERGSHGKRVFKFQLQRIPGQPEIPWREVKKSQKVKVREGLCVADISFGKEVIPICAINTMNDENPPQFYYRTSMIYPDWCNLIPPVGCDCTDGCSDSRKCSCMAKNGGVIPFNHDGALVEAKPLAYECGPACKCSSTCYIRVSQRGIKFKLEIFKTKTKGWGVRSLNSISSGSFICEYTGELLEDNEAEKRTSNDEYLFDIGNNYGDSTLRDELSTIMPDAESSSSHVVENGGFTIDAAYYGNVGRFINHSCSPNLLAQNVLYDHEDRRIPHIMLFAAENIPPLKELSYHYNYKIDQVYDSDGNIKKKNCFCGSVDCTGRMY